MRFNQLDQGLDPEKCAPKKWCKLLHDGYVGKNMEKRSKTHKSTGIITIQDTAKWFWSKRSRIATHRFLLNLSTVGIYPVFGPNIQDCVWVCANTGDSYAMLCLCNLPDVASQLFLRFSHTFRFIWGHQCYLGNIMESCEVGFGFRFNP